jgi:hypothetical protein
MSGPREIRVWTVLVGVLVSVLGHAATAGLYLLWGTGLAPFFSALDTGLAGQGVLAIVVLSLSAWFIADPRRDRGLGMGLLGGWAALFVLFTIPATGVLLLRS